MERRSTDDNFEDFLRQNAEDFRLHPSPKVWEGISNNLHQRKRRYYFGFLTLLITSGIAGYTFFQTNLFNKTFFNKSVPDESPSVKPLAPVLLKESNELPKALPTPLLTETENKTAKVIALNPRGKMMAETDAANQSATSTTEYGSKRTSTDIKEQEIASLFSAQPSTHLLSALSKKTIAISANDEIGAAPNVSIRKKNPRSNRFGVMFYLTPTISYRKLSENKSYLRSPSPVGVPYSYAALYNINNAVTHKPDMGLEFGATSKYAVSKNVKLRAGVQFNINRYDIKAFSYVPEVATIALNNGRHVDSLNTISNYRNFNGGKTDWLQNFYFQISTPVGAEVRLHGNDKMYFGVASTIQPTYILGNRAYVITADYKNYAQVPWLIRRWNVNTNLETFVAYSTKKVKWQIGPQVRYQLLSSFVTEYPVKENLFDFGLKMGISLNPKVKEP